MIRRLFAFLLVASALALGQGVTAPTGSITTSSSTLSAAVAATCIGNPPSAAAGACFVLPNTIGAYGISLEEIPLGSPSGVTINVYGCMRGTTCDTVADSNTSTSNAIRGITFTKLYGVFVVLATMTGGSAPSITINSLLSTANNHQGGGASLPAPPASGDCLVSTGNTVGAYTWGSCSGSSSFAFNTVTAGANTAALTMGAGGTLYRTGGHIDADYLLANALPSIATGYLNWTGSAWALSAVNATPCTTTANSLQIDSGGSFGCAGQFTYSGSTLASGATGILNLAAGTMDLPSSAAYAPTTAGLFGYDSTNNRAVLGNGTNTSFLTWITAAPTTNVIPKFSSTHGLLVGSLITDNGTAATYTGTGGYSAPILVSTVAIGTAPLTVTSTTPVANLSIGGNAATATTAGNVTGIVALVNGGTGTAAGSATAAYDALAPTTTQGDITYRGLSSSTRLAIGSNGSCLTSNGTIRDGDPARQDRLVVLARRTRWRSSQLLRLSGIRYIQTLAL